MTAMISFLCPECKAQLRGPAEMQGKKARCKRCGHTFVLKAAGAAAAAGPAPPAKPTKPAAKGKPPAKAPPPKRGADDQDDGPVMYGFKEESSAEAAEQAAPAPEKSKFMDTDHNPYAVTTLDLTPRCPFCAKEMESAEAIICLHCGYNTRTRAHSTTVRTYANTAGDLLKWLLPGILCVVGILALAGGIIWLWTSLPNPDDPKNKEAGDYFWVRPAQVWGSVVAGFMMFAAGSFAVYRLILHPTPPEVEKKK
jgi:DNA-directed RNA polymerase subunit RPC12/RpoP